MELTPTATLSCLVNEENSQRKELYSAQWQQLSVRTRAQERCSLNEVDDVRKESYNRKYQVTYLVQRNPNNVMRMGRLGEALTEYRLPYRKQLPLPIFSPTHISNKVERAVTPPELSTIIELERALGSGGRCQDKRDISEITRELPPVIQPVRLDSKKADMVQRSLSRSMSQEAQRG
ncbi:telethonin-like [Mustelus asterias]